MLHVLIESQSQHMNSQERQEAKSLLLIYLNKLHDQMKEKAKLTFELEFVFLKIDKFLEL